MPLDRNLTRNAFRVRDLGDPNEVIGRRGVEIRLEVARPARELGW
jgi:hypothetical protein